MKKPPTQPHFPVVGDIFVKFMYIYHRFTLFRPNINLLNEEPINFLHKVLPNGGGRSPLNLMAPNLLYLDQYL